MMINPQVPTTTGVVQPKAEAPNTQMCWWKEGQVVSRIGIALKAKGTLHFREW